MTAPASLPPADAELTPERLRPAELGLLPWTLDGYRAAMAAYLEILATPRKVKAAQKRAFLQDGGALRQAIAAQLPPEEVALVVHFAEAYRDAPPIVGIAHRVRFLAIARFLLEQVDRLEREGWFVDAAGGGLAPHPALLAVLCAARFAPTADAFTGQPVPPQTFDAAAVLGAAARRRTAGGAGAARVAPAASATGE